MPKLTHSPAVPDSKNPGSNMTNGNPTSPPLPVALAKTPVKKQPVVVLQRQEFLDGNYGSVPILVSPTKTPDKNSSRPKLPSSPIAARTGMLGSDESTQQMQSPTKRETPRKSHSSVENNSAEQMQSPTKQGTPRKFRSSAENNSAEQMQSPTKQGALRKFRSSAENNSAEQMQSPTKWETPRKFRSSAENNSAEEMQSATTWGTPRKSHSSAENNSPSETETRLGKNLDRNTSAALKSPRESSSALGVKDKDLQSVRHRGRRPVVVVLEDFECFNSQLLQDLITICG